MSKFTNFVAIRYFLSKKNEKFVSVISMISLIGIIIGVSALIVVMSVMNGFHKELTLNIIGANGDINIRPYDKYFSNVDKIKQIVAKNNDIKFAHLMLNGQAMATHRKYSSGVVLKGIDKESLYEKTAISDNIYEGSLEGFVGEDVVAVGSEIAASLRIKVGDRVKLISPNTISTAFGSVLRAKDFTVIAVFNSGLYEFDAATFLMPLKAAQNFMSMPEQFNLFELTLTDSKQAINIARSLQRQIGIGSRVASWQEVNKSFLSALEVERVAMFVILSLIILVAAFNILSSLFMLVKDKQRDIAILRTIGATSRQILLIFITSGMIIGTIGTLFGALVGYVISSNIENLRLILQEMIGVKLFEPAIYFLYSLPSDVQVEDIIFICTISLILCFVSTIYPAYKAASISPVEVIKND